MSMHKHAMTRLVVMLAVVVTMLSSAALAQNDSRDPRIAKWLDWADQQVAQIINIPAEDRTYENTIGAYDDMIARVQTELTYPQVLSYLSPDAEDRAFGNLVTSEIGAWGIDLGLNRDLYEAVKEYVDTKPKLKGEDARSVYFIMRSYRRAGMDLPDAKREELKAIQNELSELSIEFNTNAQVDETSVLLTSEELAGVPMGFFDGRTQTAGLWVIPLNGPTTIQIWTYCPNEVTRKKLWVAYKREGGEKNVLVLEKILKLRAQEANLLGYASAAAYQTEILMTKNAETVAEFYKDLMPIVRAKSDQDYAMLVEYKRRETGDAEAELYAWDYWYYADIAKREQFSVDSNQVKQYFELDATLNGLFDICGILYGIDIRDETAQAKKEGIPLWDENDVRFFRVYDKASGKMLGELCTDLHPRPNKRGGAFCWIYKPRKLWLDGTLSMPRGVVQCNFPRATADAPALLTHDDAVTLYHEFGHYLHGVLTETNTIICNDTERDFVELPSQIFENWMWDAEVLTKYAKHYETGEPLPAELLEGMIAAKQFASGMLTERQFYYGMCDQAYHSIGVDEEIDSTKIGIALQDLVEQYDGVEGTYFQAGFTHLTNYIASYYGYQWSLVFTYDCFETYKEMGLLNPEAGRKFREDVLSRGGLDEGTTMLRNFLGRDFEADAFGRGLGLGGK